MTFWTSAFSRDARTCVAARALCAKLLRDAPDPCAHRDTMSGACRFILEQAFCARQSAQALRQSPATRRRDWMPVKILNALFNAFVAA